MSTAQAKQLSVDTRQHIAELSLQIRRDTIRAIAHSKSGHPGGALGATEIFAVLYGYAMRHDAKTPDDPNRDRFVLSNGHICAALYSVLARTGYFEPAELATFRKINGHLQGHPARVHMPETIENSSGPLGQGPAIANGLALAARLDKRPSHIFVLAGDGEMQEGQVWESLMSAAHFKLSNVTLFVSSNGLQIDGPVADIKQIEPLTDKISAFGWNVLDIDGHNIEQIVSAIDSARAETARPTAIVARTVMGKGVPYMEDLAAWHGGNLSWEQAEEALKAIGESDTYTDFPGEDGRGVTR